MLDCDDARCTGCVTCSASTFVALISILHHMSQPSPLSRLPSSQASFFSFTPLPQTGNVGTDFFEDPAMENAKEENADDLSIKRISLSHCVPQPSPDARFPSSHCSDSSTMPLPQAAAAATIGCSRTHRSEQPSPERRLPSSHCSPLSSVASPQ